ncbi:MAG: sulfurtransferase TusA family protein [Gammaproteobacteria bacterium]|nr:sulfurtransferase TusA family protein [Gammaproteobacteria bacterium]MDH5593602.1 sulfurtransferase TusA family protein [Gammaproteobacteria bacterium]
MTYFDSELDVTGMACPLPVFKARQAIDQLDVDQVLHIICTDSDSRSNFPNFAQQCGHELFRSFETEGVFHYFIKKKNAGVCKV